MSFPLELTPLAHQNTNHIVDCVANQSGTVQAESFRLRLVAESTLREGIPVMCGFGAKLPWGNGLLFNELPHVVPFKLAGQRAIVVAVYDSRFDWML